MSGSAQEVQALADKLLELLGKRIANGELVIRFCDGRVQRCETRSVHEFGRRNHDPLRKTPLDTPSAGSA